MRSMVEKDLPYGEVSPFYAVRVFLQGSRGDAFQPESIKRLEERGLINKTELVETLYTHLDHPDDSAQAALALNVHRNTFLYRMERIREITGMAEFDGRKRVSIQLSFILKERPRCNWVKSN